MNDTLNITIELGGAAFADGDGAYEAARMLPVAAVRVAGFSMWGLGGDGLKLFDANGNGRGHLLTSPDPYVLRCRLVAEDAHERGKALGSWVTDCRATEEQARNMLRDYEDGGPPVMDMCPAALSGEWSETPRDVLHAVGRYPEDDDANDLLTLYENTFSESWWAEVLRACRYIAENEAAEGVSA